MVTFVSCLTLSSIYLDWTKIDFEEINMRMALDSLEMTLISKRYRKVKPTFYFENNRINSGDGNQIGDCKFGKMLFKTYLKKI